MNYKIEKEPMNGIMEGADNAMMLQGVYERNNTPIWMDGTLAQIIKAIGDWVSVMSAGVQKLSSYNNFGGEETRAGAEAPDNIRASKRNTTGITAYTLMHTANDKYKPKIIALDSNEKDPVITNELALTKSDVVVNSGNVGKSVGEDEWSVLGTNSALSISESSAAKGTSSVLPGWLAPESAGFAASLKEYSEELNRLQIGSASGVENQRDRYDKAYYMREHYTEVLSNSLSELNERASVFDPIVIPDRRISINPRDTINQTYLGQAYYKGLDPNLSVIENGLIGPQNGTKTSEYGLLLSGGSLLRQTPIDSALIVGGQTNGNVGIVETDYHFDATKKYDHLQETRIASMLLLNEQTKFGEVYETNTENDKNKCETLYILSERPTNKSVPDTGKKAITIHLNRPMIEQFTVHVGSSRDGLGELKRAVEEILLEILNSAN